MLDTSYKPSTSTTPFPHHPDPSLTLRSMLPVPTDSEAQRQPHSSNDSDTSSYLTSLSPYSPTLSVLLNEKGGIIDDMIITKHSETAFYVVTSAVRCDRGFDQKVNEWNNDNSKSEKEKVEMDILEWWGCWLCRVPRRPSTCRC